MSLYIIIFSLTQGETIDSLSLQAMFKFIVTLFVIGIIVRFLLRYILPVFRITSAASSQMRQMQDKMREMEEQMRQAQAQPIPNKKTKKDGDYIDYEEVR